MAKVVAEYELKVKKALKDLDKLQKEVKELDGGLKKTGKDGSKAINEVGEKASGLGSTFKKLGGLIAAAFTVDAIVNFGKEAVRLAAQAEGVQRAFNKLNNPNLLNDLRRATRGTVTDLQLMQSAVRADNFQIPLQKLATFFEFATNRSIETGESVDYLVNSIVDGIGRKSTLVLDNLGISASQLQAEIKKTGDFGIAAANIIEQGLEDTGEVADTTAIKISQIQTAFENLQTQAGKSINDIIAQLVKLGENKGLIDSGKTLEQLTKQTYAYSLAVSEATNVIEGEYKVEQAAIEELQKTEEGRRKAQEFAARQRELRIKQLQEIETEYARISSKETEKAEQRKLFFAEQRLEAAVGLSVYKRFAAEEEVNNVKKEISARVTQQGVLEAQIEYLKQILGLQEDLGDDGGGAVDTYVRSLNQLNSELKKLQGDLKDAEIGSQEWIDAIEEMFNKTEELNEANEELEYRLALLEGAFDKYEEIETKGIDNFVESVNAAREALKKAREEAQQQSLAVTGDEFIDPSEGYLGLSTSDLGDDDDDEPPTFDEELAAWSQYANEVSAISQSISQIQTAFNQQQLDSLNYQLQQGEITREEYDKRRREILRQQAEDRKAAAIFEATVSGFAAVVQAYNTDPTGVLAGITAAVVAAQIAAISAQPVPEFAKGVIDLKGEGTETSDSIPAKLSRGESVMTAKETRKYKEELTAIRSGNFENLILTKYIKPMIDESMFKGFADIGKSAKLNGLKAELKDHNIIHSQDRMRQEFKHGFMYLAEEQRRLFKKQLRGGYRA